MRLPRCCRIIGRRIRDQESREYSVFPLQCLQTLPWHPRPGPQYLHALRSFFLQMAVSGFRGPSERGQAAVGRVHHLDRLHNILRAFDWRIQLISVANYGQLLGQVQRPRPEVQSGAHPVTTAFYSSK